MRKTRDNEQEIRKIYDRHVDTVYRVCFGYLKSRADTEDAVSETFFKLIQADMEFESEEHEKAWLIRTASNHCKNLLKHWWRRNKQLEDYEQLKGTELEMDDTLEIVLQLPAKYKDVVYLYYYESYTTPQIAKILQKPQSTVRNYLHEARKILKNKLEVENNGR
jgi:RNA polymerase sigma-70 factor (ECF subfamily)